MVGAIAKMVHPLSALKEIGHFMEVSKSKYVFTIDLALEKFLQVVDNSEIEKIVVMSAGDKMKGITKVAYNLTKGRKIKVDFDNEYLLSYNSFIDFGYMYDGSYICKRKSTDPAVI